jgi:hypothetical protein
MASNDTKRVSDAEHAQGAHHAHHSRMRHSDVVPRDLSSALSAAAAAADRLPQVPHLSWPEPGLRVPDETGQAWSSAYEASLDTALANCDRGDWLVPLVYAAGKNDARLAAALVRFAYEVALELPEVDTEAAFAVLEVAQSALESGVGKETCARIASNSIDEAYARFASDRRFDRYFFAHCAAAVARLAAGVTHAQSARDAIAAIQSAAAARRTLDASAEPATLALAARCIREALGELEPARATQHHRA